MERINLNCETHFLYPILREAMYRYMLKQNLLKVTPMKEMNHTFSEEKGAFFIETQGYDINYTLKMYGDEISLDLWGTVVDQMTFDLNEEKLPFEWETIVYKFLSQPHYVELPNSKKVITSLATKAFQQYADEHEGTVEYLHYYGDDKSWIILSNFGKIFIDPNNEKERVIVVKPFIDEKKVVRYPDKVSYTPDMWINMFYNMIKTVNQPT